LTKHCYAEADDSWKKHVFHSRLARNGDGHTQDGMASQQEIRRMNLQHIDCVQGPIVQIELVMHSIVSKLSHRVCN